MASEHARRTWTGIDVGGRRKGLDVAVLGAGDRVALHDGCTVAEAVALAAGSALVGVDAPAAWAPHGERSRPDERAFARAGVCGIRFTPDEATARARTDDYLGWVWHGLELYDALSVAGLATVEVFPTAAWTVWLGDRGERTRLAWARAGWRRLLAGGLEVSHATLDPTTPTQDAMDAVAAALVTREAGRGAVRRFGTLAVPEDDSWPL